MGVVQLTPTGAYVVLVAEFPRSRRATEFDECCVRVVAKIQQFRVDAATLPRPNLATNGVQAPPLGVTDARGHIRSPALRECHSNPVAYVGGSVSPE